MEQIVPRGRRLELVLGEELRVGHEHQRIVGDRGPLAVGLLEARGQHGGRRRLVVLEHVLLDAGREGLDRPAEQHVDARIVLLGDDARERLARGEAQEVHLDAARGLELLQHRPRPVLRPDRIDVERFLGDGRLNWQSQAKDGGDPCQEDPWATRRPSAREQARGSVDPTVHVVLPWRRLVWYPSWTRRISDDDDAMARERTQCA